MGKTIYHYCSSETFLSILSNKTLRMTNIKKSNDYSEVINSLQAFQTALQKACERFMNENPDDTAFRQFFKNVPIDDFVENAINNDSLTYYAACFSEEGDSLSQWRGYANDATGVAIGFDSSYLANITDYRNIKYMEIEYNAEDVIEDLIFYIKNKLRDVKKAKDKSDIDALSYYENALSAVISSFVYNAVFYKNHAFAEEKEWRVVFYPFGEIMNLFNRDGINDMAANQLYYDRMYEIIEEDSKHGAFTRKPLSFGVNKDNVFSYVDLDFSSIAPYFVKEIILGPKNRMNDLDLRLYLLSEGYDPKYIKIIQSKATYQ